MDSIDKDDAEDLGYPNLGSGGIPYTGGSSGSIGGSTGSGSTGGTGTNTAPQHQTFIGQLQSIISSMTLPTPKTSVCYVVVLEDGSCLELDEQQVMTPREMLNLCKFVNLVSGAVTAPDLFLNWSEIIKNLGIRRHFKDGLDDYTAYPDDSDVLYIYLFDVQ